MDRLIDLIKNGTLIQLIVAVLLSLTVCYLVVTGQTIPETLANMTTLVLGFYFGSHAQSVISTSEGKNVTKS